MVFCPVVVKTAVLVFVLFITTALCVYVIVIISEVYVFINTIALVFFVLVITIASFVDTVDGTVVEITNFVRGFETETASIVIMAGGFCVVIIFVNGVEVVELVAVVVFIDIIWGFYVFFGDVD